jgi:glycine/D-amino acid oxidase-like deaminating enzyme
MTNVKFDLAIIGGGICGLSHAAAAASKGLKVAVFEKNIRCLDASARNFGLLTQLYDDGARNGRLAARSRELYEFWSRAGGLPFKRTSSLQLAQSESQLKLLHAFSKAVLKKGIMKCEVINAEEAQRLAPALSISSSLHENSKSNKILGALYIHGDALIEPRVLTASLPSFLSSSLSSSIVETSRGVPYTPVTLRCLEAVHSIKQESTNSQHSLKLTTSRGNVAFASHVAVCSGADVVSLLPHVFSKHSSSLKLCKLQMMRLGLPKKLNSTVRETLPLPVTSGLTLRRYPAFSAFAPLEREEMIQAEKDEIADTLGIHIIARPSAKLPRTSFGNVVFNSQNNNTLKEQEMDESEVIVGDSHQYLPLPIISHSSNNLDSRDEVMQNVFDEACDENVTNEILRVAGTMLKGVHGLYQHRIYRNSNEKENNIQQGENAHLLSQWTGMYLQHNKGLLNVNYRSTICETNGKLDEEEDLQGSVHIVTGLGGAGMTLSPALGEDNVNNWFR